MGPPDASEIKDLVRESSMLFSTQLQGNTWGHGFQERILIALDNLAVASPLYTIPSIHRAWNAYPP